MVMSITGDQIGSMKSLESMELKLKVKDQGTFWTKILSLRTKNNIERARCLNILEVHIVYRET